MADPTYKGAQTTGLRGFLGSFMNPTPNYIGTGQPTQRSSLLGGGSPTYLTAPAKPAATADDDDEANASCDQPAPPGFLIVVPRGDSSDGGSENDD
ncbi:MAG: hypothetical protein QM831_31440 [Kofleriaceae bacterium]